MATKSETTCKCVAFKLRRDLQRMGVRMKGRVHITKNTRSTNTNPYFTFVYENNGENILFRTRKAIVAFLKAQDGAQKNKNDVADAKAEENKISNDMMLEEWMDKRIEKNIIEKENMRTSKEWIPTPEELSRAYKEIVVSSMERKAKIQQLMSE